MAHFNFRLFLRPTPVGKVIIDRLTAEGADRQAEARRWIELGYMCEQAGFRLDGGTLFQPGRPAAAEQLAPMQVPVYALPAAVPLAPVEAPAPSAALTASPTPHIGAPPALREQADPTVAPPRQVFAAPLPIVAAAISEGQPIDEMATNLRALAH